MSENTQVNDHIEPKSLETAATGPTQLNDEQFDAILSLLRLLLGGTLIGVDEVRRRMRQWEAATSPAPKTSSYAPADSLRYTLVGMLFETETRLRRRFSATLKRLPYISSAAEYLLYTTLMPTLRRTPLDPLLMRLDDLLFLAMVVVDRWSVRGWIEEQHSRQMAQHATVSVVDELIDYMAQNPGVRELIEQQSLGMAGTAVDEIRGRTATADMWIERLAHSLLHRPTNEKLAKPAADVEALPPAAEVPASTAAASISTPTPTPAPTAKVRISSSKDKVQAPSPHGSSG